MGIMADQCRLALQSFGSGSSGSIILGGYADFIVPLPIELGHRVFYVCDMTTHLAKDYPHCVF